LAICNRIIEAHGGKISVQTAIALGSKFTVAVPINPAMTGRERTRELSRGKQDFKEKKAMQAWEKAILNLADSM
jgi:signal transduction histidine kinase